MERRRPHDLVRDAIDGDLDAIERVVDQWVDRLYAWCARLGGPTVDAEEAAHDVLMLFVRRHATIREPDRLGSWMFSACRRVVANHRRRAWWRRWLPGPMVERGSPATMDQDLDDAAQARRIRAVLDAMSVNDREVLTLCYLEETSVAEAAQILGVAEGTVKSRLFNARARFRDQCRDLLGDGP
ncbi:MAG: sigma-70 family RNA polymerase sigma factor [Myxococcota bacterium]